MKPAPEPEGPWHHDDPKPLPTDWTLDGPPIRTVALQEIDDAQQGDTVEVGVEITEDRAPKIGHRIAVFRDGKCRGVVEIIEVAPKRTQRYRAVVVGGTNARTTSSKPAIAVAAEDYCCNRLFQSWDYRGPYQKMMNDRRARGAGPRRPYT